VGFPLYVLPGVCDREYIVVDLFRRGVQLQLFSLMLSLFVANLSANCRSCKQSQESNHPRFVAIQVSPVAYG
jgi:hypothetical protein